MDPSVFFGAFQQKILAQWRFAVSFDFPSTAPGLFVETFFRNLCGVPFRWQVVMATSWRFDEWRPKNDGSTITYDYDHRTIVTSICSNSVFDIHVNEYQHGNKFAFFLLVTGKNCSPHKHTYQTSWMSDTLLYSEPRFVQLGVEEETPEMPEARRHISHHPEKRNISHTFPKQIPQNHK